MTYPLVNGYITPRQHGFIPKRLTVTNLMEFTQFVSKIIDKGGQVDVIYADFSKAFNRINFDILLRKLSCWGFTPSLVALFASYLKGRRQVVAYNNYRSDVLTPTSGAPQRPNLGPLLFTPFVNDLPSVIDCEYAMFADDPKIFNQIGCQADCSKLHSYAWFCYQKYEIF